METTLGPGEYAVVELTAEQQNTSRFHSLDRWADTGDLAMRIGLHSGPVTVSFLLCFVSETFRLNNHHHQAGVLQGDRARFQIFGDTVNTAARMERCDFRLLLRRFPHLFLSPPLPSTTLFSTGVRGKIQLSQATYNLLFEAGKGKWCKPREDIVEAKGKGVLKTYFLEHDGKSHTNSSASGSSETSDAVNHSLIDSLAAKVSIKKNERLIDWVTELLLDHLRKLVATRNTDSLTLSSVSKSKPNTPRTEVSELINMPRFCEQALPECHDVASKGLSDKVVSQLHAFVARIADLYRDNPFHNFEHACHVAMSTDKLLKR